MAHGCPALRARALPGPAKAAIYAGIIHQGASAMILSPPAGNTIQGFPGSGGPRTAGTRRSALSINRFHSDVPEEVLVSTSVEDSYVAILQLSDHPPHDVWIEGRHAPAPRAPKGGLTIIDLNRKFSSLLKHPVDSLMIQLPRAALDDIAEDAGATKPAALSAPVEWTTQDVVLQQMQGLLLSVLGEPGEANRLFSDHLILAAGTHIAQAYGGMTPRLHRHGTLAPWQERRAKELIAANLGKQVPLAEIAETCGLSLAYFSRAFKASTGATPHGWLEARRIETARGLLLGSGASLAEIALASGFADQSHFTRIFRRATGTTPAAWRRLYRTP